MKRGRPAKAKAIKRRWYSFTPSAASDDETPVRRKRRYSMASLWRICDPLPIGLTILALGVTQFNNLSGKTMAVGLVILLTMLLFGQVIEPCWRKQCERAKRVLSGIVACLAMSSNA